MYNSHLLVWEDLGLFREGKKKERRNNNNHGHCFKKLIGTLDEQMATASALKHLFGSLFGKQQRERRARDTHLSHGG